MQNYFVLFDIKQMINIKVLKIFQEWSCVWYFLDIHTRRIISHFGTCWKHFTVTCKPDLTWPLLHCTLSLWERINQNMASLWLMLLQPSWALHHHHLKSCQHFQLFNLLKWPCFIAYCVLYVLSTYIMISWSVSPRCYRGYYRDIITGTLR